MSPKPDVIDDYKRICEIYLSRDLQAFIRSIPFAERADFFDGRNADTWKTSFAEWLRKPKEFASND